VNVSKTAQPVGIADVWPETAPTPYGYLVAHDGAPDALGLIADMVLDGGGVYLAAATPNLAIRIRLASAAVPGLPIVPMGVSLTQGRIPESLWRLIVEAARAAMPSEILLAIVARKPAQGEVVVGAAGPYWLVEPQLDESGSGDWRPQQASGCAVRATPVHDAIVEVHSHHAMRAFFSATDDRDETGRRIYGVLGRLAGPHPEIALRVVSGCNPLAVGPVAFSQVFAAETGEFRDINYSSEPHRSSSSTGAAVLSAPDVRARARQWCEARLLFELAEDVAAIRDLVESNVLRPDVLPNLGFPR
jgi:Prokaryotic homologs of the JAB domain